MTGLKPGQPRKRSKPWAALLGDIGLNSSPDGAGWRMLRKLVAEVDYLKQVVANRTARLAIGEMPLDLHLLAPLERAVDVVRNQFLTLPANHD